MKKLSVLNVLVAAALLTACTVNKPVPVVKGADHSVVAQKQVKQVEIPTNLPSNVTAICRDGAYSTATENACSGNGGVSTRFSRYFSE